MTFPRVVSMAVILSCISIAVLLYFTHHMLLLLRNQTTYEYDRLRALGLANHRTHPIPSKSDQSHLNGSYKFLFTTGPTWLYSRGVWANLYEVFGTQVTNSLRDFRRRLPIQMEFKTQ